MGGDARARSWESGGMLIEELRGTCATGGLTTNGIGAVAGVSGVSGGCGMLWVGDGIHWMNLNDLGTYLQNNTIHSLNQSDRRHWP